MKILVTGGSGLVGQHLKEIMPEAIYVSSIDYDLCREADVMKMFKEHRPTHVVHLAARVAGILDNINHSAEYYTHNVLMNTLTIDYAYRSGAERLMGIISTCAYPEYSNEYPLKEYKLHDGPPTNTSFSYAMSKRGMATQIDAYNNQYDTKYNYLIPCNLYGMGDKDNEIKSHFVTALIKKIYDANVNNKDHIVLYGDGTPIRQFMYAGDLAQVIKECLMEDITETFNVATKESYSIDEIAKIALRATESSHLKIIYDPSRPNGQYRKDACTEKINEILPNFKPMLLKDGIQKVYRSLWV